MKQTQGQKKKASTRSKRSAKPRLTLVRGGRSATAETNGTARVRDGVVDRARTRVSKGYYDQPRVQRQLVDTLWKELCSD